MTQKSSIFIGQGAIDTESYPCGQPGRSPNPDATTSSLPSPLSPLSPLSSCSSDSPRLTSSFDNDREHPSLRLHTLPPSETTLSPTPGSAIPNQLYNYNTTYSQDVLHTCVNSSALSPPSTAPRHGHPSNNSLDNSSSSHPNNVSLTSQSNSVALQQLANHYGIPSVLPKPPLSNPAKVVQKPQPTRSTPPLPDFESQLSNYLSMLAQKPESNQSAANESVTTMATNTIETAPQKDATTMDKDAQALQSVVDTLMASPEFRNLPTMNSPALTSPNSFLTSPFDTPLQQFDTSPIIDFADTFDGTSPMDTPLFDEFNTSPIDDSPFLDVLNTPVMDGVDGLEMYTTGGPLFDDGGVGMYEELEQVVKQPAPTTAATEVQWDALLKMSPQTAALDPALVYPSPSVASEHAFPALPAPQEAAPAPSPAPSALPTRRKQPSATGTRRNITPESLVPYDAPTQTRRYAMPSATSKKEVPATFARKKRKAMGGDAVAVDVGDDQLDDAELPPLKPDATEVEQIEYKRRQNTLAARKSRKRKLEYQQGIEVENSELKREVEVWKTRCELLSGMLKGAGINVDVQALAASK